MLDTTLKTQLKAYLEKLTRPIQLLASLDDSEKAKEMQALLREIAELSDKISLSEILMIMSVSRHLRLLHRGMTLTCVSPVFRWGTSSHLWCLLYCRQAVIRLKLTQM